MKLSLSRALLVISLAGLALVGGAQDAVKHSLRFKPTVGQEARMRSSININLEGEEVQFTSILRVKVTEVDKDGSFTLEEEAVEVKIFVSGTEIPVDDDMKKSAAGASRVDARGVVKELTGGEIAAPDYRLSNLMSFVAPEKDVAVGDSWTYEHPASTKTGAVKARSEFKFEKIETVGGHECAVVKVEFKELEGENPSSMSGTFSIRLKDGQTVKLVGNAKKVLLDQEMEPVDIALSYELQ